MALVAALPSSFLSGNLPQVIREPRGSTGLGEVISSLQVGLLPFKSTLDLCQCGSRPALVLSCSKAGRESQLIGFSSISFRNYARPRTTLKLRRLARAIKISRESTLDKNEERQEEDDTDLCPVECVREFTSQHELDQILQYAKKQNALVVVDFFKTACGSCRYIENGFQKLCKGAGNTESIVIFLKHNVMDEYEEQSEVAENYKIKVSLATTAFNLAHSLLGLALRREEKNSTLTKNVPYQVVPLFHFYKDAKLVESFPTREKTRILEAICRHTGLHLEDVYIPKGG